MPGLVKIGYTLSEDAAARIAQLYASGVPFPFKLEFAAKVTNADEVERALHRAFAPNRVNPKREFFSKGKERPRIKKSAPSCSGQSEQQWAQTARIGKERHARVVEKIAFQSVVPWQPLLTKTGAS
jgi:hypothetical protein